MSISLAHRRVLRLVVVLLAVLWHSSSFASGEIVLVKAPEEIPEGDDISVAVSASAVEPWTDRAVVLQYPESWKVKIVYRVEAGSTRSSVLPQSREIEQMFSKEPGQSVVAIADNTSDADPESAGVAYFITFTTKPIPGANTSAAQIKAALVERTNPDAPAIIDKKTKKARIRNTTWRMVFPFRNDFSFAGITTKKIVQSVKMLRLARNARALLVDGTAAATGELKTMPEVLSERFRSAWSIQFWFKTTGLRQTFFRFTGPQSELRLGTGLLGQPLLSVSRPKDQAIIVAKAITNDGAWHHLALSKDASNKVRLFIDAQPAALVQGASELFENITGISIGDPKIRNDFSIDELRLHTIAFQQPSEFEETIAVAGRDTMSDAFALFHFDEYGSTARSSVSLPLRSSDKGKGEFVPMAFALDSDATIVESSSPVQLDAVMLTADLLSPTKVSIKWSTTSELGIRQYRLERRVGSFGTFEKVLVSEARHGLKAPKRGQSIISHNTYSAAEDLPKLSGDIELFYRLAILGFNDKAQPIYSQPINLEYGADRDVFVEQNQPNPFNPTTNIAFRAPRSVVVRVSVFDIIGREVAVLANGKVDAGRHVYKLDATNWPGGIYFYKVKTARSTVTRKMVLAK